MNNQDETLFKLRYPIGKFTWPVNATDEIISEYIEEIKVLPEQLEKEVKGLTEDQLDTPYRPEGWTIRQVVHHMFDSHINSYMRFKLTVTEEKPTIKPYFEDRWAELPDAKEMPIDVSLQLLKHLHTRWVYFLNNLSEDDLRKTFIHPELNKEIDLKSNIALYAWHCRHHLAHIVKLKEKMSW